ncbi:MAG: CBS domain-containing protein [Desulfitobacteriaceae bacterium]|nr:CBS domain-containing protein [Desulfitobacteriaceae bacterium]
MKVRDVMSDQVEWANPSSSIMDVAKMMEQFDVGSVPVCENKKLKGIVTDRDIVLRGVAKGANWASLQASQIMSTTLVTVTPDTDAHEASDLMSKHQIRRLPVVDKGELVGMLALGDLAIERIHVDEAGEALSDISRGIQH